MKVQATVHILKANFSFDWSDRQT